MHIEFIDLFVGIGLFAIVGFSFVAYLESKYNTPINN